MEAEMKAFTEFLARNLVSRPDAVDVRAEEQDGQVMIELRVDPSDLGAIIGRRGRTAGALRTLLEWAAARREGEVTLRILD